MSGQASWQDKAAEARAKHKESERKAKAERKSQAGNKESNLISELRRYRASRSRRGSK